jgi:hypothetical protein
MVLGPVPHDRGQYPLSPVVIVVSLDIVDEVRSPIDRDFTAHESGWHVDEPGHLLPGKESDLFPLATEPARRQA